MATSIYRGNSLTTVKQVHKGTITSTTGGHTYISTITDDQGVTHADTYTLTGSEGSVTAVGNAVVASFNANPDPYLRKIVASNNAGVISFTARTAGVPFSIALTGTGSWGSTGETTANVGTSDLGVAVNWTDGYPTSGDDLVADARSPDMLYGLNLSGVDIGDFITDAGFNGDIGRIENGTLHRLRLHNSTDALVLRGSSELVAIGIGSAAIPVLIEHEGNGSLGDPNIYLDGSAITNLTILSGHVAIAGWPGQSSTFTGIARLTSGTLQIGGPQSAVTVTGTTLYVASSDATAMLYNAPATIIASAGQVIDHATDTITLADIGEKATLRMTAAATVTTLKLAGTLDLSQGAGTVTITNPIQMTSKAKILDPNKRLATGTQWTVSGGDMASTGSSDQPRLLLGPSRTYSLIS